MMTAEKKIEAAYNKMEQKKNNLKKVYHRAWLRISYYTSYDKLNKWYEKELSEIKKQFHDDIRKAYTA